MIEQRLYDSAKNGKKRRGQSDLMRYLKGARLTQRRAIYAKCYDCNGMGEQYTCDIKSCSLFPYSQFKIDATGARSSSVERKKRIVEGGVK